jgi:hypothetical protein
MLRLSDESHKLKYGLPASEHDAIVQSHFVVMLERNLIRDLIFAHAVHEGAKLRAAEVGIGPRCTVRSDRWSPILSKLPRQSYSRGSGMVQRVWRGLESEAGAPRSEACRAND